MAKNDIPAHELRVGMKFTPLCSGLPAREVVEIISGPFNYPVENRDYKVYYIEDGWYKFDARCMNVKGYEMFRPVEEVETTSTESHI